MISKSRLDSVLKAVQIPLYLAFVFLWFKHNFPAFRAIRVSWPWAFVPLAAVTAARLFLWAKSKRIRPPEGWRRDAAALLLLVALATVVRLPFLGHSFGLMDSDEAVPALMAKHISEGRPAPLYFYGANFQGSLPQHYAAVLFLLFGYSVPLAKIAAFLAFGAFLCVQFFLLKKIFSFGFACAVGVFYVLPWVELIRASVDIGSAFPVVLFFGTLILSLTVSVVYDDRLDRLGTLGFVLGLAFWTHQIIFIFALAAAPFLVAKLRLRIRAYLKLAGYALVGVFPVLINEWVSGFSLVRFLVPGEAGPPLVERIVRTRRFLMVLFTFSRAPFARVLLVVLAAGLLTLVALVILKKLGGAALVYPAFVIAFLAVYIASRFSSTDVVRYMYVLYVALPVLFAAPFLWIGSRLRYPLMAAFVILVFAAGETRGTSLFLSTVKADHRAYSEVVSAMLETGEKRWISDFWGSYLLTSLSGERLIVASYGVRRYYPYELDYWTEGRNNWVLLKDKQDMALVARALPDVLGRAGVGFKLKDAPRFSLVYRIDQDVFPKIILADPPAVIPDIRLEKIGSARGRLELGFVRRGSEVPAGLGFVAEIPGYSARPLPMPVSPNFTVEIPFPEDGPFRVGYAITYAGLRLPATARESEFAPGPGDLGEPRPPIEFLRGIGPQRPVLGRRMSICAREACLEISRPTDAGKDLVLDLFSPFDFDNVSWYGDFTQTVSIFVNDRPAGERPLAYGKNRLVVRCEGPAWRGRGDVVRLRFRYAMPVSMTENWKTAAFLEHVDLK